MIARHRQSGVALFIVLIFIVILALFSVSAFNSSTANVRITNNAMVRNEAVTAAQSVIETTISSTTFTSNPAGIAAVSYPVDIDGNGTSDYTVQLAPAPSCYRAQIIKTATLDPAVTADLACMDSSVDTNSGIDSSTVNAAAGDSLCANTEWNIRATSTDARTGASAVIDQGIGVRALSTDAATLCTG